MKHHELNLIYALLALIFIVFSLAIIRLYHEQLVIKDMFSVGMMQMKEQINTLKTPGMMQR